MVSLYVTAVGYLVEGGTPSEVYDALKNHGYLSDRALMDAERVLSVIEETSRAFHAKGPPPEGPEAWRDVAGALAQGGYLSDKGLTEGLRRVTRDGQEVPTPPKRLPISRFGASMVGVAVGALAGVWLFGEQDTLSSVTFSLLSVGVG